MNTNLKRSAIKQKLDHFIGLMDDAQLDHFEFTLEQVANCYMGEDIHSTLLVRNDKDESQSVFAINADRDQVSEMILFMAEAIQQQSKTIPPTQLN